MKSNLSVGPPLDLVVYEANRFETDKIVCIDMQNPYFRMLHSGWARSCARCSTARPGLGRAHTDTPLRTSRRAQQAAEEDHAAGRKLD